MSTVSSIGNQTATQLPVEDQPATTSRSLSTDASASDRASAGSPVAADTGTSTPPPTPEIADSPQAAVAAVHSLPLPNAADLAGMSGYVPAVIYAERVETFNNGRAEYAQQALDRFQPQRSDFDALPPATANFEYAEAVRHYNADPYIQELRRVVDEATSQPGQVPAYLRSLDQTADTGRLPLDQMSSALAALGVEMPANPTPEQVQAGYDILATLPDSVLGWAINPGSTVSFDTPVIGAGTPGFIPGRVNASMNVIGEVELSDVQTGINFDQTQQFEMSVQMEGSVGASFGRTPLNQLYKWANRLGALPQAAQDMVNSSPLLKNVVKGLPIPVSANYEQFEGTRLTYEAVVTPEQGSRIAEGDLSATPNPLDPMNMPIGTSVLIRGDTLQGSTFEATYKLLTASSTHTELEGTGFGVRRIDADTFEIYSGPIETVENEMFLGLGKHGLASIGFGVDKSLEVQEMSVARVDLRTEEGQAAYQTFMNSGQIPNWSPPGVSQSGTTQVIEAEHAAEFGINIGGFSWGASFNEEQSTVTRTEWQDGTSDVVYTHQGRDGHVREITSGLDASGNPVDGGDTYRIMLTNSEPAVASYVDFVFNVDPEGGVSGDRFDGNQNVQMTFSESDLMGLRDRAREFIQETGQGALLEMVPQGTAASNSIELDIALAETPAEVFDIISREHSLYNIASFLPNMTVFSNESLPGQVDIRAVP